MENAIMQEDKSAAERPTTVRPVQLEPLQAGKESARNLLDANMELVQDVKVRLTVSLGGAEISIGELFALKEEGLLKLDKATSDPVEILLDGRPVARGELMASGDHFAVRITEIGAKG
jgi:flagellar motor switch protein FliN/FliY